MVPPLMRVVTGVGFKGVSSMQAIKFFLPGYNILRKKISVFSSKIVRVPIIAPR